VQLPKGESIRKAAQWITEMKKESPSSKLSTLIEQAGRRFDLTPIQQEALLTWLTENPKSKPE
jgi:hypothetical protein